MKFDEIVEALTRKYVTLPSGPKLDILDAKDILNPYFNSLLLRFTFDGDTVIQIGGISLVLPLNECVRFLRERVNSDVQKIVVPMTYTKLIMKADKFYLPNKITSKVVRSVRRKVRDEGIHNLTDEEKRIYAFTEPHYNQTITTRSPADEALRSPRGIVEYAKNVIKGRWPEGEEALLNNFSRDRYTYGDAIDYARDIIKGRWPELEVGLLSISSRYERQVIIDYARDVIKGRWPEGEKALIRTKHGVLLLNYIKDVLIPFANMKRWPEAEKSLIASDEVESMIEYAKDFLDKRWPELEEYFRQADIQRIASHVFDYIYGMIKDRWPEIEDKLFHSAVYFGSYVKDLVDYSIKFSLPRDLEFEKIQVDNIKQYIMSLQPGLGNSHRIDYIDNIIDSLTDYFKTQNITSKPELVKAFVESPAFEQLMKPFSKLASALTVDFEKMIEDPDLGSSIISNLI